MFLDELRHAVRNLGRAPRFSVACVFTLALALAATATLLNLLETFVFRQLAVSASDPARWCQTFRQRCGEGEEELRTKD